MPRPLSWGAGHPARVGAVTNTPGPSFHDLPAHYFPFTIEFFREDTGEVVHTIEVAGPGGFTVPALGQEHGVPIGVRAIAANGKIILGRAP